MSGATFSSLTPSNRPDTNPGLFVGMGIAAFTDEMVFNHPKHDRILPYNRASTLPNNRPSILLSIFVGGVMKTTLSVTKGSTRPGLHFCEKQYAELPNTSEDPMVLTQEDDFPKILKKVGYETRKGVEIVHSACFSSLAQPVVNATACAQKALRGGLGLVQAELRTHSWKYATRGARLAALYGGAYDFGFQQLWNIIQEKHHPQGAARQVFGFGVAGATGAALGWIAHLEQAAKPGEKMIQTLERVGLKALHPRHMATGGLRAACIGLIINGFKKCGESYVS